MDLPVKPAETSSAQEHRPSSKQKEQSQAKPKRAVVVEEAADDDDEEEAEEEEDAEEADDDDDDDDGEEDDDDDDDDGEEDAHHKSQRKNTKKTRKEAIVEIETNYEIPPVFPYEGDIHITRVPKVVKFEPTPYERKQFLDTYSKGAAALGRLTKETTVRWRRIDDTYESNARLVRWSDGSLQLLLHGDQERFDVAEQEAPMFTGLRLQTSADSRADQKIIKLLSKVNSRFSFGASDLTALRASTKKSAMMILTKLRDPEEEMKKKRQEEAQMARQLAAQKRKEIASTVAAIERNAGVDDDDFVEHDDYDEEAGEEEEEELDDDLPESASEEEEPEPAPKRRLPARQIGRSTAAAATSLASKKRVERPVTVTATPPIRAAKLADAEVDSKVLEAKTSATSGKRRRLIVDDEDEEE
jgi:hypothetical protein